MSGPSRFEQFVRFSNDSVGLERLLRLLQSLMQILTSYPLLITLILPLLASFPATTNQPTTVLAVSATLLVLRGRIALARRFLRVFRFLDNFLIANRLFFSSSGNLTTTTFLTALSRTFNGLYLLLEAATLPDALDVEGLYSPVTAIAAGAGWSTGVEGKEGAWLADPIARTNMEAQRFWFLSLVFAVAAGSVKLAGMRSTVESEEKKGAGQEEKSGGKSKGKGASSSSKKGTSREYFVTVRKLMADFLDLALPGAVVGWVPLGTGQVSVVMLVTTILTGWEVWERVGKDMVAGSS